MQLTLLKSKIHRASITHSNIDYEGSIFIDDELLTKADILPYERVEIYNVNNGQRFTTYAVPASCSPEFQDKSSKPQDYQGYVCINGAAARLVQVKDLIIICSYSIYSATQAHNHQPTVVLMDGIENQIKSLYKK